VSTAVRALAYIEEAARWLGSNGLASGIRDRPPREEEPSQADHGDRPRVLVADDNADMREYLSRVLGEHWDVTVVPDGDAALHALLTARFDLVVTDVMMPRMDGFRLLQAIRAEESLRSIPVIMLSARAGEEARIEGRDAGADDYLTKPFTTRELVAQVRAHLAAAKARGAVMRERELLLASERAARLDLQRQWEDLQRTFEQVPNPIVVLRGPEYRIELANDTACRIWGRTPAQVHHRALFEALPELRGQGFEALLERVMRTGEPYKGSGVPAALERNGVLETLYFDFVYSPLRGTNGRVDGILVVAYEVTEQMARAASQPAQAAFVAE